MNENNNINNGLDQNIIPTPNQDINGQNTSFNSVPVNTDVNQTPVNTNVETNIIPDTNDQNQYTNTSLDNNTYKLILNRKKSFIGCAVAFSIYVDNEMVGKIKNGKTLEVPITPGNHTISVNKKNEVTIQVTGDTTADVTIFGSNDFGITNINGQNSSTNDEVMNKKVDNTKMNSNVELVTSLFIQPVLSIFLFKISPWITIMFCAIEIGYILIDLLGLKNLKQYFKEKYTSCLVKKIISLIVAIILVIVLMYLNINGI